MSSADDWTAELAIIAGTEDYFYKTFQPIIDACCVCMFVQIYLLLCYPSFFLIITVRNEVAKVMFLHLSVILFTGGGYLGRYPSWTGTPSRADTPPRPGTPLGRYTPRTGTPARPGTPPGRYTPGRYTPRTRYTPRAGKPPRDQVHPLGADTATVADGTHPTGMHFYLSVCPCVWLPLILSSIPHLAWCM